VATQGHEVNLMPRVYVNSRGNAGMSFGCIGTILIGFLYLMGALLFVGLIAAIIAVWLLALLVAWIAAGVDQLLVRWRPSWRARRAAQGPFRPVERVQAATRAIGNKMPSKRRR
jgi:hypothetical protein